MEEAGVSGSASCCARGESAEMAVPTALTFPRHKASPSSTQETVMLPALPLKMNLYSPPERNQLPLYFHSPPGVMFRPRRSFR